MNPAAAPDFGDSVAGCLLGGAVGDALGAVVEFDSIDAIRSRYGPDGLVAFPSGGGRITDDTQMSLFTAEALIRARRRYEARRVDHAVDELWWAYRRWLDTQGEKTGASGDGEGLVAEPDLRHRRAPGHTCLSALIGDEPGSVEIPVNDSKGCGGVMRVAPVGLVAAHPAGLGIASAALTHGHPSGYLAAGAAADILSRLRAGQPLRPAAEAAAEAAACWAGHEETVAALRQALSLARPGACSHSGDGRRPRRGLGRRGGALDRRVLRPDRGDVRCGGAGGGQPFGRLGLDGRHYREPPRGGGRTVGSARSVDRGGGGAGPRRPRGRGTLGVFHLGETSPAR